MMVYQTYPARPTYGLSLHHSQKDQLRLPYTVNYMEEVGRLVLYQAVGSIKFIKLSKTEVYGTVSMSSPDKRASHRVSDDRPRGMNRYIYISSLVVATLRRMNIVFNPYWERNPSVRYSSQQGNRSYRDGGSLTVEHGGIGCGKHLCLVSERVVCI
jgi:hypothetical protein